MCGFMKKKKSIIFSLLLILLVSNFTFTYAYWASQILDTQSNSEYFLSIGEWEYIDEVATFISDYQDVLALTVETVEASDKAAVEAALAAYGLLSEDAKAELTAEQALLISLLNEIIAFENSEFLDFEGYIYDSGLTGTVNMNGRTWYGNAVYIANDPVYDVWNDTRSLALNTGAYFESRDYFINGIEKMTIYHGALNYNNGASFQFRVEYELASNPGVWLTLQEGGSTLLIDVISATPLSMSEINVQITEALNIRFVPVISNAADYINLDDIRIYEYVVSSVLEATTFRTIYAGVLALTVETVEIVHKGIVEAALAAYDLLSNDAKAELTVEKALLDNLLIEIEVQEVYLAATQAVVIAENTNIQANVDAAQNLVSALPAGAEKAALQARLDVVQNIINAVATFISDYQDVLALTVEMVQVSDKGAVEAALAAYNALSIDVKAELTVEKALLESLLVEINSQIPSETQVLEYRTNHASALALTVDTVAISNRAIVEAALVAYNVLSNDAKAELTVEKALLDSLIIEIEYQEIVLEATQAVVIAENTNIQANVDAAQNLVTALPAGAEKAALQARLDVVQNIINAVAAAIVDDLITSLPSIGAITLSNQSQVEEARTAYELLTPVQKTLVDNEALLTSLEAQLIALDFATNAVVTAENSNVQADVDAAQQLINVLVNGTSKSSLQSRLDPVQDIIDVEQAQIIITNYFASNSVTVSRLNSNAIKQTAFLAKANEIVDGLDVVISITNTNRINQNNTIYTILISKNGAQVTVVVNVNFVR